MEIFSAWISLFFVFLAFSPSSGQHVDEIIQWEDDVENKGADPLLDPEEHVIHLADLQKPKWREALKKYDNNHDGKLSGNEIILAYPEIQSLIENEDGDPFWWFTPDVGMYIAVAIGIITLGYALYKFSSMMSLTTGEKATRYEMNRQHWLDKLEKKRNTNLNANSEARDKVGSSQEEDLDESDEQQDHKNKNRSGEDLSENLYKRKPDEAYDPVTSKMPRYQQLSAIRRCPGSQSPKPTSRVYQQLLPDDDDDDLEENSGDETVGNTRKRRQHTGVVAEEAFPEKVLKDRDSSTIKPDNYVGKSLDFVSEVKTVSHLSDARNSAGDSENTVSSSVSGSDHDIAGKVISHTEPSELTNKEQSGLPSKIKKSKCTDSPHAIYESFDSKTVLLDQSAESVSTSRPELSGNVSCSLNSVSRHIDDRLSSGKTEAELTSSEEEKIAELDPEARQKAVVETLSYVLDSAVEAAKVSRPTYSSAHKTLRIAVQNIASHKDDIANCIPDIVKVMTVRQVDKVKYGVCCFERCEERLLQQKDSVVNEMCSFMIDHFIDLIVKEVAKEQDCAEAGDDDLWSDYTSGFSNAGVHMLGRIVGHSEDGVVISENLLCRLLQHEGSDKLLCSLLQAAGRQLKSVKRVDELILQEGAMLRAVEILLSNPMCRGVLSNVLEKELNEAANGEQLGNFFEKQSIFGPLLSVSTAPAKIRDSNLQKSPAAIPFLELKGFPRSMESDVKHLESVIQEGLHRCQNIIFNALKKVLSSKLSRENGLAWVAAVVVLNDMRTAWTPEPEAQHGICCSDGFMLNFCPILVELFLPAINSPDLLAKVDLSYSANEACRLNFDFEICLAGGQIVSESTFQPGRLPEELQGRFNFLTECYHMTQRSLSVGVIPAISHYNRLHRQFSQTMNQVKGTSQEELVKDAHVLLSLMWDVSLLDPELVRKTSQFYICQSKLLLKLIEGSEQGEDAFRAQKKLLSKIPEFCVKDMAIWFQFVAQHVIFVHRQVLSGISLSPFVDCCVALLAEPTLMPGPVVASKVVSAILAFVRTTHRQQIRDTGWRSNVMSDLAMMVHTCPSVKEKLGPALIHTYVSVDVVEGLDVDKDEFDKYSARADISYLVQELWERMDSRASILNLSDTKLFQDFLGSVLDTLLYMLHDSLARLANVRKLEAAKDNDEEWGKLSYPEKAEKTRFLKAEEAAAHNFMTFANNTLAFVDLLTKVDKVARCFTKTPLSTRSASAISGFLGSLCGSKSKDFKVKNMEKYNFDPQSLLMQIVSVILRIAEQDASTTEGFVVSMAIDADFSPTTLENALSVIARKRLAEQDTLDSFSNCIENMQIIHDTVKGDDSTPRTDNSCTKWQDEASLLQIDSSALCDNYKAALSDLRFDTYDLQESHSFQGNTQALDPRSTKIKALMKEMKQLRSNLPVHPDAAIFVRQDEDRIDLMRAVITGPVDTPYSLGCFAFDIYFPNNYPNIPPLVKIITTGNGTVRFNPNLYSDGKVCLSLLGTWHAGDASEKWSASNSSLYQVLVSIQSLILIPHPMFNEPGYEGLQGTKEGQSRSKTYNSNIRLWTIRHAMLGQLRSPPSGFEDLIRQHFRLQKDAVLKLCSDWLRDCEDEEEEKRLRTVVNSLREELDKLV